MLRKGMVIPFRNIKRDSFNQKSRSYMELAFLPDGYIRFLNVYGRMIYILICQTYLPRLT